MPQTTDECDITTTVRETPKLTEKNCANSTLATKNRTWIALGLNPDVRGEKSAAAMAGPSISILYFIVLLVCL